MAKHRSSFVRWPTALVACLVVCALALSPAARGQVREQPSTLESQPLTPPGAADVPSVIEPLPSTEARLRAIENQMQKMLDENDEGKATVVVPRPSFQIGGQIQIDYLYIGQNTANRASVGAASDVIDFRRARLTGRGEAFEIVEYSIGFDFALAGRPTFLDNWIAVRDLPLLGNVRVGHFFEPFSLDRITQNRYNTFMERSLADAFAPARNLGIMAHDTIGDDQIGTWAVGWFRANSNNFGDDFSSVGGNAVTSRVTWLPIYDDASGGRTFLHPGGAYTYRSEDEHQVQFLSFPEARQGTPSTPGIPPFVDTGVINALNDQRAGVEFAFVYGPLYLQGEYIGTWVDQINGPPLFFQAAYGFVSYFLTGENRTYNKRQGTIDRVYPYENFFRVRTDEGTATGWGAWEVAARWSYIDLTNQNIQGGRLNEATVTLNWHLNPYTRVKWEYIYAMLDRAPVGNSFAQIGGMRFDMDF